MTDLESAAERLLSLYDGGAIRAMYLVPEVAIAFSQLSTALSEIRTVRINQTQKELV